MKKVALIARAVLASALFAGMGVAPAMAVTNAGGEASAAQYVAAFSPAFGNFSVPYIGTMQLVMYDGSIHGTYTGISSRPDFLTNRIEPVIGTIDPNDGYVQFHVGDVLSFRGMLDTDGTLSGTATYNGLLYDFAAKPGSPAVR